MMRRVSSTGAGIVFLACIASSPVASEPASNPDIDFCNPDGPCERMIVMSMSSVFINKTTVTQQSTDGLCEQTEGVIKRNLSDAGAKDAVVNIDPNCQYKVRFNTSSGCIGDKQGFMKPGQIETYKGIYIHSGCGSLKTGKYKTNSETKPVPTL